MEQDNHVEQENHVGTFLKLELLLVIRPPCTKRGRAFLVCFLGGAHTVKGDTQVEA